MDHENADLIDLPPDEAELRQSAAKRVWICPGAGYALLGWPALAVATYLTAVGGVLGPMWLVIEPNVIVGWTSLVLLVAAIVLWISEVIAVKRVTIRPAAPALLIRGYPVAATVGWLAGSGAAVALVVFVGSFVMAGGGMTPTVNEKEQLIYHKRVNAEDLRRSRVITFRTSDMSAWQPGALVVARILAGPGDRIAVQKGRYTINGEEGPLVSGGSQQQRLVVLPVPSAPASLTVPENCYFMAQDNPRGSYDSQVLWWAERKNVVSTRIWFLRQNQFFELVE